MDQTLSRNRRSRRCTWAYVALVGALIAMGCGSPDGREGTFEPPPNGDSGAGGSSGHEGAAGGGGGAGLPAPTAGAEGLDSNPVDQLFANPDRTPSDFLGTDGTEASGYGEAADFCYSADDACGSIACTAFASCCVDTGACCEPLALSPLPASLDFDTCSGQTLTACAADAGAGVITFGPSVPVLTNRGLIPSGNASSDGGALIGDLVDLSSVRVRLEVAFSLPSSCSGTCLESAGVAFTAVEPSALVDPEVGLLLSGSRQVVHLMVGGVVIDTFPAGTSATVWSLEVTPQGTVEVRRNGLSLGSYGFDVAGLTEASLVVYGRNLNGESDSAAIRRVAIGSLACDNPRGWIDRQPLEVSVEGDSLPSHQLGRNPSIARHGGTTYVAYELDQEIFIAERSASSEIVLPVLEPALVAGEPYEAFGIEDPEIVSDGSSLRVFYTARDATGAGSIASAVSVDDPFAFVKNDGPDLTPAGSVLSFDSPSVVYREGLWLMIVRATLSTGATELQAYYASSGEGPWTRIIDGGLEPLTEVTEPTSDITGPSLIVHNSAYHLYYARRTGTRWAIELAVSDELLLWRPMGTVLEGSAAGFDALGARSPDALSRPNAIDLVYSGQDGVSFRLGTASRRAPSATAPAVF